MAHRILVVDDDPDVRQLLQLTLETSGFEAAFATNGREAVDQLVAGPGEFAALILDLAMPELSGFGVLEEIRDMEGASAVPVLVLSARIGRDSRMDAYLAGGHLFVNKPFDPDDLVDRLRELIERSATGRQADRLGKILGIADEV